MMILEPLLLHFVVVLLIEFFWSSSSTVFLLIRIPRPCCSGTVTVPIRSFLEPRLLRAMAVVRRPLSPRPPCFLVLPFVLSALILKEQLHCIYSQEVRCAACSAVFSSLSCCSRYSPALVLLVCFFVTASCCFLHSSCQFPVVPLGLVPWTPPPLSEHFQRFVVSSRSHVSCWQVRFSYSDCFQWPAGVLLPHLLFVALSYVSVWCAFVCRSCSSEAPDPNPTLRSRHGPALGFRSPKGGLLLFPGAAFSKILFWQGCLRASSASGSVWIPSSSCPLLTSFF